DEIRVHFDGHDARRALQQFFGKSAAAGADLNNQVFLRGTGDRRDAFENRTFDEEMLAEFRARDQPLTLRRRRAWKTTRVFPEMALPLRVAGVKRENIMRLHISGVSWPPC